MDLDKDGKLTVHEFDRFVHILFLEDQAKLINISRFMKSPVAHNFVSNMKASKAVEDWAVSK